ncbi:hypothetical protein GGI02_004278 [Coemansia sp. RSA 2322]|nr:hypothetical protein GGI02_004278 [Coemansia sp. RSA 2322]
MVGKATGADGGSKGFSLFSAINGLFERARSSAEKESQRLFTLPIPEPPRPDKERQARRPESRGPNALMRDQRELSNGSKNEIAVAGDGQLLDEASSAAPTPKSIAKRKRSVERSPSPEIESYVDSPKRARAGDTASTAFSAAALSTPHLGPFDGGAANGWGNAYDQYSVASARNVDAAPVFRQAPGSTAFALPRETLRRSSTVSTVVSDTARQGRSAAATPIADSSRYAVPPVAEPARLEKVERELRTLKKIIASLLPDELNDDDLRSVYGDADVQQARRLSSSDDIIMQLLKTRLGAGAQLASRFGGAMLARPPAIDLPPSPTSNSPTRYGLPARSILPAPPPPPPPPPPVLPNGRQLAGPSLALPTGRPRSAASLLRRDSTASEATSSLLGGYPAVHSATVRRLRADLRPVSSSRAPPPPPPPPPHKDPGVMTRLLEEMKHHKLRSVKKPKDMVGCNTST